MLGLSWGKNLTAENHVLRSPRWIRCRLPRSVNTIAEDMKLDLPADRLTSYAAFLNIPVDMLQDAAVTAGSDVFGKALSKAREMTEAINLPLFSAFSQDFCKQYYHNNHQEYITPLFKQLYGLYSLHVYLPPYQEIHNGCAIVHLNQDNVLSARAFLCMMETDIQFDAIIFRWSNNIHISYYSTDMFIFGRLLAEDPSRQFAISRRKPFSLSLCGVSDTITGPQTHGFVFVRAERMDLPADGDLWEQWRRTCLTVRRQPLLSPRDATFAHALDRLLPPQYARAFPFSPKGR